MPATRDPYAATVGRRKPLIEQAHRQLRHVGAAKVAAALKKKYHWVGMQADAAGVISQGLCSVPAQQRHPECQPRLLPPQRNGRVARELQHRPPRDGRVEGWVQAAVGHR